MGTLDVGLPGRRASRRGTMDHRDVLDDEVVGLRVGRLAAAGVGRGLPVGEGGDDVRVGVAEALGRARAEVDSQGSW